VDGVGSAILPAIFSFFAPRCGARTYAAFSHVIHTFSAKSGRGVDTVQNEARRVQSGVAGTESSAPEITVNAPLRLLTRTELADALQVSPRTVDRMQADGEITPVVLRGYLVRFYLPDVVRQLMARALVSKRGCSRKLQAPNFNIQGRAPRRNGEVNH
jgi:hypothetical protein